MDAGSGDAAPACTEIRLPLERVVPTLVVLLDQSGSMAQNLDGANRWTRIVEGLTAPSSPLRVREDELRLGLVLFTSNGGFGVPTSPRTCPLLQKVEAAITNYANVESLLQANSPSGDSPGAESITLVAQQLAVSAAGAPASILWIVDGYTDSCEDASLADEVASTALSVQAVTGAFGLGIRTQLIDIGSESSPESLSAIARAGAGGAVDASAFRPTTAAEFATALELAVDQIRSCEFELPPQTDAADVDIRLGDTELAAGANDGWELVSSSRLRLRGSACAALKDTALPVTLQARACP